MSLLESNTEALERLMEEVNNLPDPGSGGGTFVQTDWDQYDNTEPDFLKNKPFGDFPTVILEEQELPFDAEMGAMMAMLSTPIQAGDRLSVEYDGVKYEVGVVYLHADIQAAFGNMAIAGGVGGEEFPFLGAYMEGMCMLIPLDETSHTVKISNNQTKKINGKYLDSYAKFYVSDPYIYVDNERTVKATRTDIMLAVANRPLMLNAGNIYLQPVYVNCEGLYANITCHLGTMDNFVSSKTYYTAEYTPET